MSRSQNEFPGSVLASSTDFCVKVDDNCHCLFCSKHFVKNTEFQSYITDKKFKLKKPCKTSLILTCKTSNVIYLISCAKCKVQYVGLTSQKVKNRFSQHKSHIKNDNLNTFLCNHFNSNDHSFSDCRVQIIDYIEPSLNLDKDTASHQLRELEDYWIKTLNCVYPFGLNDRVLGFLDVRKLDVTTLDRENTPYHNSQSGIHRRKRSHGKRKPLRNRQYAYTIIKDLLQDLLKLFSKSVRHLYTALKSLSIKNLIRINECLGEEFHDPVIPTNFREIVFAYTTTVRKPAKINDKENAKLFCSIPFTHKIIDSLNLQSFFNLKFVRKMIPSDCKLKDSPIITYKYGRNISQSIMNYKNQLSNITLEDITATEGCDCASNTEYARFVDQHHKHVFTGNLDIIQNFELKHLMKKGTKFRECPKLDFDKIFSDISTAFDKFCLKWAKKEKIEVSNFNGWLSNIKRVLRNRLYRLKRNNNVIFSSKLKQPNVTKYLKEFQERFVITNIDKAGNNFGIVCKKYYIDVLKKELGINNRADIKGNDVYALHTGDINATINSHKEELRKNFNINVSDDNSSIPTLFWIPKLHKNPFKSRFIAGASKCTTKQLSIDVTLCLTVIRNHFRKYCNTIFKRTGINCFWSINNSTEFITKIENLRAKSINCFDFSTLYTNLPLNDVKKVMEELIIKMFQHNGHKYIKINTYTKNSYWSEIYRMDNNVKSYTMDDLLGAINFLLDNTFIQFGPLVFQQIKGIPMGSNCSPLLADLYLAWLEYKFMKELIKKDFALAKHLSFNARYIDDIACVNIQNFMQIAKQIYPKEIPLESNNSDNNRDVFLDLDIKIVDDRFILKIYHKIDDFNFEVINFPFPDSNISEFIGYNTFLSQILRFGRVCSKFSDFSFRVNSIFNKLKLRGYQEMFLFKYFHKFCCKFPDIVMKFGFLNFKDFRIACFPIN